MGKKQFHSTAIIATTARLFGEKGGGCIDKKKELDSINSSSQWSCSKSIQAYGGICNFDKEKNDQASADTAVTGF